MNTPIENRDLTQQAPHSPRDRYGGFAVLGRTVDKCRASIAGTLGEYHYDCPLDNQLFAFKNITGDQFKMAVLSGRNYEGIADWLESNGTPKAPAEIEAWSAKVEAAKLKDLAVKLGPDRLLAMVRSCLNLGLNFETVTIFEWLEADDEASFRPHAQLAAK
jgi:hypothetical protein